MGSTEGGARKRPESSSPEKLKARNKEKYQGQETSADMSKQGKGAKKGGKNEDDDEDDDENYEEEFDKLLDKDDDEEEPKKGMTK